MSDRIDALLAEQARQNEAFKEQQRVAAELREKRAADEAVVAATWGEKSSLLSAAIDRFNERLEPVGMSFTQRVEGASAQDLFAVLVHDGRAGMHGGRFRVTKGGLVFARVSSDNMAPWHSRDTTVESLDEAFLDEFLGDILEARLKPTDPPRP